MPILMRSSFIASVIKAQPILEDRGPNDKQREVNSLCLRGVALNSEKYIRDIYSVEEGEIGPQKSGRNPFLPLFLSL